MISRYDDLLPAMRVDVPHCDDPLIIQRLQLAGREFARKTEAWRERLTYNIVDSRNAYTVAYNAAIANNMDPAAADVLGKNAQLAARQYVIQPHYDADVIRCWRVWTYGDDTKPIMDPSRYQFNPATATLSFNSDLQQYTPTATAWVTSHAYTVGKYVLVNSLRYICAKAHTSGTWATDLANFDWQLMPNDLIIKAVLLPRLFCNELAGWFMEKWAEGIIAKAMADLLKMKNKNWSSPERVPYFEQEYNKFVQLALRERFTEDKSTEVVFDVPQFVR